MPQTILNLCIILLVVLPLPLAAEEPVIPSRSGLPWASGVTRPDDTFARWRGRPLDIRTVYFGKMSWDHMRASANGGAPTNYAAVIGMGMLPESHRAQLAQCGVGAFDAQITAVRDNMLVKGWRGSIIRLGWEANRVDHSTFPWAAIGDGSSWVACFRRWVDIFNPVTDQTTTPPTRTRNFYIAWNMANQGTFPYPIDNLWPGGDYVDIVGSQFYDRCPPITTDAEWTRRMQLRDRWGNPASPRRWLEWAKARGKPYSIPEWGVGGSTTVCLRPGIDNPVFMRLMNRFFRSSSQDIVFESYFNGSDSSTGTHEIYPPVNNPKAGAVYRQQW